MQEARAAHSEDYMCDMLCLLVHEFHIPDDRAEEMPYLRSVALIDWLVKLRKQESKSMKESKFKW